MYNNYISGLLTLRRNFDNRIDNEIEECMRGRGSSARLKDSLEYIIDTSNLLQGSCADEECQCGKAEWISREKHNDFLHVECSCCGYVIENHIAVKMGKSSTDYIGVNYKYCPKCGSKMNIRR